MKRIMETEHGLFFAVILAFHIIIILPSFPSQKYDKTHK